MLAVKSVLVLKINFDSPLKSVATSSKFDWYDHNCFGKHNKVARGPDLTLHRGCKTLCSLCVRTRIFGPPGR